MGVWYKGHDEIPRCEIQYTNGFKYASSSTKSLCEDTCYGQKKIRF